MFFIVNFFLLILNILTESPSCLSDEDALMFRGGYFL